MDLFLLVMEETVGTEIQQPCFFDKVIEEFWLRHFNLFSSYNAVVR